MNGPNKAIIFISMLVAGVGCGNGPERPAEVKAPPAADLAPVAKQVLAAEAALETAVSDFSENNFGLAAGKVIQARQTLNGVARIQLPLAVVSQHVYTADVNLRFADAPERALVELEAARDFLKEVLLDTGEGGRAVLGAFLERLLTIIDDVEVGREEKLVQLEALQRDLAEAALKGTPAEGE